MKYQILNLMNQILGELVMDMYCQIYHVNEIVKNLLEDNIDLPAHQKPITWKN